MLAGGGIPEGELVAALGEAGIDALGIADPEELAARAQEGAPSILVIGERSEDPHALRQLARHSGRAPAVLRVERSLRSGAGPLTLKELGVDARVHVDGDPGPAVHRCLDLLASGGSAAGPRVWIHPGLRGTADTPPSDREWTAGSSFLRELEEELVELGYRVERDEDPLGARDPQDAWLVPDHGFEPHGAEAPPHIVLGLHPDPRSRARALGRGALGHLDLSQGLPRLALEIHSLALREARRRAADLRIVGGSAQAPPSSAAHPLGPGDHDPGAAELRAWTGSGAHRLEQGLPAVRWTLDPEFLRFRSMSAGIERLLGTGSTLFPSPKEFLARGDEDGGWENLKQRLESLPMGETLEFEARVERSDGVLRDLRHTCTPQPETPGGPSGYLGISVDHSEWVGLRQSLERISALPPSGEDVLDTLTAQLGELLGVSHIRISETDRPGAEFFQVLSLRVDGVLRNPERPLLRGSAAERVHPVDHIAWTEGATRRAPEDPWLRQEGIESWFAVSLHDSLGPAIGELAIGNRERIHDRQHHIDILRLFATRVRAELDRRRALQIIHARNELESLISRLTTHFLHLDPDRLRSGFERALHALGEASGCDRCTALLFSRSGTQAEVLHQWCAPGIESSLVEGARIGTERFAWLGDRVTQGEIISIDSVDALPAEAESVRHEMLGRGTRSLVILPILGRTGPLGVVTLGTVSSSRTWTTPDTDVLLKIVGEILGVAVERQRERVLQRRQQSRLRVHSSKLFELTLGHALGSGNRNRAFDEIVETGAKGLEVERCGIWLFSEDHRELLRQSYFLEKEGHDRQSIRLMTEDYPRYISSLESDRLLDADDAARDPRTNEFAEDYLAVHGISSMLDAPIRRGGRVVGVVCHEHVGPIRTWSDDEKIFAASMADLASVALEASDRRRAEDDMTRRHREMAALHRVANIALRVEFDDGDWEEIAQEVASSTSIPTVLVCLKEHEDGRLWIRGAAGLDPEVVGGPFPIDAEDSIALAVLADGKVRSKDHAHGLPELRGLLPAQPTIGTYACVPLRVGERVHGCLTVAGPDGGVTASGAVSILESFAGILTSRIERQQAQLRERELRTQLFQAQKLEAVGNLAGGIAHDFNNLLTAVLGQAQLLREDSEPGSAVHEAARAIQQAGDRASELTRKLLGYARRGKTRNESLDVAKVIREVVDLLERTLPPSIEVRASLPEPEASTSLGLLGDPGQIHQVILNLAVNARDAMDEGGLLEFRLDRFVIDASNADWYPELDSGLHVEICVRDTGSGIPPDVLERIYEPFFTTKSLGRGTGMGLAMVYGIVQAHHAAIRVESLPGEGTEFRLLFPSVEDVAPLGPEPDPPRGTEFASGRVLLIDDEPLVRRAAEVLVRRLGYVVVSVESGADGLELLASEGAQFDLVLLDVMMPVLDGRACLRLIREEHPDLPVVFTSGWTREETAAELLDLGAQGFVEKPLRVGELAATLARALAQGV